MQIVIDISEQIYNNIIKDPFLNSEIYMAIKNGTVLPKRHGDLKDMGNLQYVFDLTREDPIYSGKDIERAVKAMKSIIEADTESEDKRCR